MKLRKFLGKYNLELTVKTVDTLDGQKFSVVLVGVEYVKGKVRTNFPGWGNTCALAVKDCLHGMNLASRDGYKMKLFKRPGGRKKTIPIPEISSF